MPAFPPKTNYAAGDVLTAAQMNDVGNALSAYQFTVGKNKIINGDFYWNQRNFTSSTTNNAYGFDRWKFNGVDGTVTYSAQTFTLGTAPVSGYESTNFARIASTGQTLATARSTLVQNIESVRTLAGQNVVVSFWAKAASGTPKIAVELQQNFGSGGSPSADNNKYLGQVTISTTWNRYSLTTTLDGLTGKTLGTAGDNLSLQLWTSAGSNFNTRTGSLGIQTATIDFWGVQVEAGSTATPFTTASGSIGGELELCQRYYFEKGGDTVYEYHAVCQAINTTTAYGVVYLPVTMRTAPSIALSAANNFLLLNSAGTGSATASNIQSTTQSKTSLGLEITVASGIAAGNATLLYSNNTLSARLKASAEL